MTWATRITIARILLIPVFVGCLVYYASSVDDGAPVEAWRYAAVAIFAVAAISDAVDGYLARHCHQASELGALLDPIADKLLLLASLLSLGFLNLGAHYPFPLWFPIVLLSRDALLLLGFAICHFMSIRIAVRPHWSGKVSTVFTFLAILGGLLKVPFTTILCALAAGTALIATAAYIRTGHDLFLPVEKEKTGP